MKNIISHLQIMTNKKGFQIIFLLLVFYALGVSVAEAVLQRGTEVTWLYHPASLTALNDNLAVSYYFVECYPFLAVLPACFSLFHDRTLGVDVMMKSRMGERQYYFSKAAAAFCLSFFTFTVPFLLELLLNVLIFPLEAARDVNGWSPYNTAYLSMSEEYLLSDLFFKNQYIYCIVIILLVGLFSGCAAVFTLGISCFRIKYQVFLFLPVYLIIYISITQGTDKLDTNLQHYLLHSGGIGDISFLYYLVVMAVMLLVGAGCIAGNMKRNELA